MPRGGGFIACGGAFVASESDRARAAAMLSSRAANPAVFERGAVHERPPAASGRCSMANESIRSERTSKKPIRAANQPLEIADDDLEPVVGGVKAAPAPGEPVCVSSIG